MDDPQNNRLNPADNPFNQSEIDLKEHYDEFGNRVVKNSPPEPTVTEVLEEDLGITPKDPSTSLPSTSLGAGRASPNEHEEDHQKTASSADSLVSRTDSFNDWTDTLKSNITYKEDIVKTSEVQSGMELPGVEPGITNSAKPKRIILAVIIVLVAAGLLFTLYQTRFKNATIGVIPTVQNTNDTIRKISNLVELPIPEQPSQIANVSDVARLAGNPFFEKAQNGDVVLLYQKNKTAILYRPSSGKVVAIGPLNTQSSQQVAGTSVSASPSPSATPSATPAP